MKRICLPLLVISGLLLVAGYACGVWGQLIEPGESPEPPWQGTYHLWISLAGTLAATAMHGLVFTYFMGTGRWVRETVEVYELAPGLILAGKALRRRARSAGMGGFGLLLVAVALGAATDTRAMVSLLGIPAGTIHHVAGLVAVAANLVGFYVEYEALDGNGRLIEEVLVHVRRIRVERGLPV